VYGHSLLLPLLLTEAVIAGVVLAVFEIVHTLCKVWRGRSSTCTSQQLQSTAKLLCDLLLNTCDPFVPTIVLCSSHNTEMFGMHVSADASLRLKESTALFQAVLALQPRENSYSTSSGSTNSSSSSSSTGSSDELVVAAARHVLSVLPHNVKYQAEGAVNALTRKGGGAGDSLLVVLVQELDRYYSNCLYLFVGITEYNCTEWNVCTACSCSNATTVWVWKWFSTRMYYSSSPVSSGCAIAATLKHCLTVAYMCIANANTDTLTTAL
jgi:hypothetical protein